jgi:hypothetical protein
MITFSDPAKTNFDSKFTRLMSCYPAHRVIGVQYAAIQRMMHGQGRFMIGYVASAESYERGYCYEDFASALIALAKWDGQTEPQGWFRSLNDGRRRPNGDPALEYINH